MKILFIGDVFGKPGRKALAAILPRIISNSLPDMVIVNVENAAHGAGITKKNMAFFNQLEVDVFTTGNHVMQRTGADELLKNEEKLLRPANFPSDSPGRGWGIFETASGIPVAVINLQGLVFMAKYDCPFDTADSILEEIGDKAKLIFIDFHAEATSEKKALACYLDGRITALCGTHTHVPTADEQILPGGTAYISDVGMTGPQDSVLGVKKDIIIRRFRNMESEKFEPAKGDNTLMGVLIEACNNTGLATNIERIWEKY